MDDFGQRKFTGGFNQEPQNVPEDFLPQAEPSASEYEDDWEQPGESGHLDHLAAKMREKPPGGDGIGREAENTLDQLFGVKKKKDEAPSQSSGNPAFPDEYEDDF
jgi:hypothetical protein